MAEAVTVDHQGTVRAVFKLLEPTAVRETVEAVEKELKALDVKIGNLTRAIEAGDPLAGLVETATARQAERTALLNIPPSRKPYDPSG